MLAELKYSSKNQPRIDFDLFTLLYPSNRSPCNQEFSLIDIDNFSKVFVSLSCRICNMGQRDGILVILGAVEVILGLIVLIGGSLVIYWRSWANVFGHGIWGGLWGITCGSVGVAGGLLHRRCLQQFFLWLNVIYAGGIWIGLTLISSFGYKIDSSWSYDWDLQTWNPVQPASCWQGNVGETHRPCQADSRIST